MSSQTSRPIEIFLSRLEKVRQIGPSKWVACCPAHDDRTPSMSIKDTPDKILIHCFAGCDITTILGNVGLEVADIFHTNRPRHDLELEELVVAVADLDIAAGKRLSQDDRDRYRLALRRLSCR